MSQLDSQYGGSPVVPQGYAPPAQPVVPVAPGHSDKRDLYAVASAAIGISLITMCVPFLGYIAVFVVALVFGILGLRSSRKGLAVAGIVCAVVWMLVGIAFWVLYGAVLLAALGSGS